MLVTNNHSPLIGLKRKRSDENYIDSIASVFERAEDRAGEREERMRRMELEVQEKMREREDRQEERMFTMFTAFMSSCNQPFSHPVQQLYNPPQSPSFD